MSTNVEYKVFIHTGDVPDAGTDCDVYWSFIGTEGESSRHCPPQTMKNWGRASTDVFTVHDKDVGTLTGLRIGHNNKSKSKFGWMGNGWFLDNVMVEKKNEKWIFPCSLWLDDERDDKLIERVLKVNQAKAGRRINYKIIVTTADEKNAGTDSDVSISLIGDKGDTGFRTLKSDKNNFEQGTRDPFFVESDDIGALKKVILKCEAINKVGFLTIQDAWKCECLVVEDPKRGSYAFDINEWFDKEHTLKEFNIERAKLGKGITYTVEVTTGDLRGAGTSAKVYLFIKGTTKTTDKLFLENAPTNFSKGSIDVFTIETDDLGDLTSIVVGHDNTGLGADWFLQNLTISHDISGKAWHFACGRWFSDSLDDKKIEREINLSDKPAKVTSYLIDVQTGKARGSGTDANVFIIINGTNGLSTGKKKLDNTWNNFETGQLDKFKLQTMDVGPIVSIVMSHDNSGVGPGWFLDKVTITNTSDNTITRFPVYQWFAVDEDDGLIERTLYPSDADAGGEGGGRYEVHVHTGDRRGAGTDASVGIQVYGTKGKSRWQKLDNSDNNFERNQVDVFKLQCPQDLGDLTRVKVGHDNSGLGPGWYLEKIIVKDVVTGKDTFFLAGRWLAKDEGDGAIEIEIPASGQDGTCGVPLMTYKITVFTGDRPGAGTDANVFITLFGEKGELNDKKLENDLNNFERNKVDVFRFQGVDIGNVGKIRIRQDGSGIGAAWFLDKVIVTNGAGLSWYFLHGKWLDKENGISAELEAQPNDGQASLPLIMYRVDVVTGDRRGAGTDANVSIELYGEGGRSGVKKLEGPGDCFERNKTDTFGIEVPDLGKLTKIRIGHDNSGFGPGWFLDKVVITSEKTLEKSYFMLGDWLEGDHHEKELPACAEDGTPSLPLCKYQIDVTTGDRRGAGTDANVYIILYGSGGDSGRRTLEGSGNLFERNQTDTFGFECVELGELKKIQIGHDNSGFGASWFLDKVIVTNAKTTKKWYFLCGRWLATDEDDHAIVREIPSSNEDGVCTAPLVSYKISVTTGDRRGAGTDANVFITLFGTDGDSGERQLEKPGNNFERNKTDIFEIECVSLGELQRIIIRHDGKGIGSGWFLDKVIAEAGTGDRWYFPCGRWLDVNEDDRQISREIGAVKQDVTTYIPLVNYRVKVLTGDRLGAGTDAAVYLTLYGDGEARSEEVRLENGVNFRRASTDVFSVQSVYLGAKLSKARVRLDPSGMGALGAEWFLDKIVVSCEKDQTTSYFLCGDWIGKKKKNVKELAASDKDGKTYRPMITYTVTVKTGTCRGAGTDADVFIILYGKKSDSGKHPLEGPGNLFERGQKDVFALKCVDLGEVKRIRIGHDGSGIGAGWFCEDVTVESSAGGKWYFPCRRWFDAHEGDKLIERELVVDGEPGPAVLNYLITVYTGKKKGSGTDANVYASFIGSLGRVDNVTLDNAKNNFEEGQVDHFKVQSIDLGEIKQIVIGHDNSGLGPGWYLERVDIEVQETKVKTMFPCNRWLDKTEDDGQIVRTIVPGNVYTVKITTGKENGAGTDSGISCKLHGTKGNSGEIGLKHSEHVNKFEVGQTDTFSLGHQDIGDITAITLRTNDKGVGADWLVDTIVVTNESNNVTKQVKCKFWLGKKKILEQKFNLS